MKEYLKRELNKTYLVLSSEDSGYTETYEIGMLTNNEPERILPLHVLRMDGAIEIYYDISSKQTLKDCAGRVKLSFEVIKKLFEDISQMMKEVKNYMLDMGCVILSLEYIYTKEGDFYFCYCPWGKGEVLTSFRNMLEEVLGLLDYHDTKGVELAYHLYQEACKGTLCIEKILEEHDEKTENMKILSEEELYSNYEKNVELWGEDSLEVNKLHKEENEIDKKKGILQRVINFFLKKEETPKAEEEIALREDRSYGFSHEAKEEYSYTELLRPSESGTVLLGNMPCGRWKLRPLFSGGEEFFVSGDDFLVGKKRDSVDGFIGRETISRIHSRLFVKGNRLFITDANSTNGTFVNGIQIQPGEEVEIFQGDRILFADVGYECYNSL